MKNGPCWKSIRQVRRAYALIFLTVLRLFHSRTACDRSAQVVCADIRALFYIDGILHFLLFMMWSLMLTPKNNFKRSIFRAFERATPHPSTPTPTRIPISCCTLLAHATHLLSPALMLAISYRTNARTQRESSSIYRISARPTAPDHSTNETRTQISSVVICMYTARSVPDPLICACIHVFEYPASTHVPCMYLSLREDTRNEIQAQLRNTPRVMRESETTARTQRRPARASDPNKAQTCST